jgi:KDO2-lipid IV(A) lauroyltransferase
VTSETKTDGSPASSKSLPAKALILRTLLSVLSRLPLPVLHAVGGAIGWCFFLIPNRRRHVAKINLALCFPEMNPRARRRLLRGTLVEFGKSLSETAALWTKGPEKIRQLVKQVLGQQELQTALAQGKGVILAIPHLGAWEMVGLYCPSLHPFTALYRPPRVAELDELMRDARQRLGARLMPANISGIRTLYRALRRGELVGILPDQVPNEDHNVVYAPFFGIAAKTMVLLAKLARQTGAPVVFTWAERLPHGRGYRVVFSRAPQGIESDDPRAAATAINQEIEREVRLLPQQYQWCYKRFRRRPPGERPFY